MKKSVGFPPVVCAGARVLILGSMPGVMSLARQQYYAQPRNAFWPIMGELFSAAPELSYPKRLQRLCRSGIALWDVLQSCERDGSLDSNIVMKTAETNNFVRLFSDHPGIDRVFFNGATAEKIFVRRVLPILDERLVRPVALVSLPSTSPAHAAMSFAEKLSRWSVVANVAS
jgi:hypoxanthine-DNA glycosylase